MLAAHLSLLDGLAVGEVELERRDEVALLIPDPQSALLDRSRPSGGLTTATLVPTAPLSVRTRRSRSA